MALAAIAMAALSIDLWLSAMPPSGLLSLREVNAFVAVMLFACLAPSPRDDLGFRVTPNQGAWYWVRIGALLLATMTLIGLVGVAILTSGILWRDAAAIPTVHPSKIGARFVVMCVEAPILEELLYRTILCVPMAAVSPAIAIAASGLLFAALHFVYGNPDPGNFFAGYVLAWAYLKSGTIVAPILLHASGNAIALSLQVAAWYILSQ